MADRDPDKRDERGRKPAGDPVDPPATRAEEDAVTEVRERATERVARRSRTLGATGGRGSLTLWDPEGLVEERGVPAYIAEFLGTFVLVLFICMVISIAPGLGFSDYAVIGLVHFLVLAMLVYTLGGTSGAHFNPAVTAALAFLRKIAPIDAAIYVLLQLSGAVAAALVTKLLLDDEGETVNYGATVVSEQMLQGKAFPGLVIEIIGTFVLMWAIMGTAVNPRGSREWAGLIIGGTLGFVVMVFNPLTGSSVNPARSFGPALVSGEWPDFWIYVVGPVIGAVLAAVLYTIVVIVPQGLIGERPVDKLP